MIDATAATEKEISNFQVAAIRAKRSTPSKHVQTCSSTDYKDKCYDSAIFLPIYQPKDISLNSLHALRWLATFYRRAELRLAAQLLRTKEYKPDEIFPKRWHQLLNLTKPAANADFRLLVSSPVSVWAQILTRLGTEQTSVLNLTITAVKKHDIIFKRLVQLADVDLKSQISDAIGFASSMRSMHTVLVLGAMAFAGMAVWCNIRIWNRILDALRGELSRSWRGKVQNVRINVKQKSSIH